MMTQCPKCNSADIMAPLQTFSAGSGAQFVRITEPRTGALQIRFSEEADISVAVCGSCGYAEQYVADAARLWKHWQKGYR
jgi:predicted nucleic-acid-binding Zn-ribbon protein